MTTYSGIYTVDRRVGGQMDGWMERKKLYWALERLPHKPVSDSLLKSLITPVMCWLFLCFTFNITTDIWIKILERFHGICWSNHSWLCFDRVQDEHVWIPERRLPWSEALLWLLDEFNSIHWRQMGEKKNIFIRWTQPMDQFWVLTWDIYTALWFYQSLLICPEEVMLSGDVPVCCWNMWLNAQSPTLWFVLAP